MKSNLEIFPGELIGKRIIIVNATNRSLIGLQGKVINETKATLVVLTKGKEAILLKSGLVLRLEHHDKIIKGVDLIKKPEDRLKGK